MRPEWAVLVYMGADDPDDKQLVVSAFKDVQELRDVKSSDLVRIAVQMDLRLFAPVRFVVAKDGSLESVQRLRESSTGQPGTLSAFLRWAERTVRARRVLLILWGHGVGVGFILEIPATLADAVYDGDDGLDARELAGALRRFKRSVGRPLDVLGFDACFMSAIEIGYELRGLAGLVLAAQGSLPLEGWPYISVLTQLKRRPRQSARRLGRAIASEVVKSYSTRTNVTQTALDPKATGRVATSFAALVRALESARKDDREGRTIVRALRGAKYLQARQFVDLADLCRRVRAMSGDRAVRTAATEVLRAMNGGAPPLIVGHRRRGPHVSGLNGVSIYLSKARPLRRGDENVVAKLPRYRKLEFVKDTGWQRFVDHLPSLR